MSEPKTAEVKVVPSGWRTMESAPRDGTPFYARHQSPFRFQPYKPNSEQARRGVKGRWQTMSEYGGWDNCPEPVGDWTSHPDFPVKATPASPPAETGEGSNILDCATWVPLDDNGHAEVRVNGRRITSMPSYAGAEEVAERINQALVVTAEMRAALFAQPVSPSEGEAVAWGWTESGTDTDGDPKQVKGKYGDYVVVLTLSRTDGAWSARINNGHGKLGFRTEDEAKTYAITTTEGLLTSRLRAAQETIALYTHPASDQSDTERMRAALERIVALGSDGEHSGDRHAQCRSIARAALAEKAADK